MGVYTVEKSRGVSVRISYTRSEWPRIPWKKLTQTEHPESYRPMRDDEEQRL